MSEQERSELISHITLAEQALKGALKAARDLNDAEAVGTCFETATRYITAGTGIVKVPA